MCRSYLSTVTDPVGAGFVESLARPGGNVTGFILFEYSMSGKWLELLKEIAPSVTRAAVLRDPAIAAGSRPIGRHSVGGALLGVESPPSMCAMPARSNAPSLRLRADRMTA